MTETTLEFAPDWVSPPGDTIADLIEERDWTQVQLSERLGYTKKHVSQLINGKAPITEETALKLVKVLGSTEKFWLNREADYRAQLAQIEEKKLLESWTDWLDDLPVKELMKQGAIATRRLIAKYKPAIVKEMLVFFGVASPDDYHRCYSEQKLSYRRTKEQQSDSGAISSWLRLGEIEAEKRECSKYSKTKFQQASRRIRELTTLPADEFLPKIERLCRDSGVVFVLVPSIPKAHVSGVARWLNPHKAVIQLSLYGKSNDKFWFTLFHEVAHILLHGKDDIFLDEWESGKSLVSDQENQANQWSRDFLIPPQYQSELSTLKSKAAVAAFAQKISVHPGVVVGRLQHDNIIPLSWMNEFKEKV